MDRSPYGTGVSMSVGYDDESAMSPLDLAAIVSSAIPIVGDVTGLAADADMYARDPESRNMVNYILSGAGVIPLIPAASQVRKISDSAKRMERAKDQGFDVETDLYHGSTHDIEEMRPDRLNPEGHFGSGYYTTTSPDDASKNYGGMGPDLTARIEERAERNAQKLEDQFEKFGRQKVVDALYGKTKELRIASAQVHDMNDQDAALEIGKVLAKRSLKGANDGVVYPLVGRSEKPFNISEDGDTFLSYERRQLDPEDYLDEADGDMDLAQDLAYEDSFNFEPEGELVEFMDAIRRDPRIDDDGAQKIIEQIEEKAFDYEGISAKELDEIMRNTEFYAEDEAGAIINNEVYRQAIENSGFDSIIHDGDIFRGMDIEPGTKHQIFFKPEQLRSKNAEFDPDKTDDPFLLSGLLQTVQSRVA
jgi:hypothetical protein